MSTRRSHSCPEEESSSAEHLRFELLDRYQCAIDVGDEQQRAQLRAAHKELSGMFDGLDRLAGWILAGDLDGKAAGDETCSFKPNILSSRLANLTEQPFEFGRYRLVEQIGRGGMGAVYRAQEPELARDVAIKIILAGDLATIEEVNRFQQEARAVAGLRHPHIVSVHDVGCTDGLHYFSMDYMSGGNLAARLRSGRFSNEAAAQLILMIAEAAAFLHERGVIHRDIKPSNIVFDDSGEPCLTDFGLAKVAQQDIGHTRTGDLLGTANYMSPEQASGAIRSVSAQSDIYSLGAVLYELLTGEPPFVGENLLDTLLRVMERDPIPPRRIHREIDRELEQICLRCLEKNPDDRYPTAAALADELTAYLRGEPVAGQASDLMHVCQRAVRRYPALVAHLVVLAAVAAIVATRHWTAPGSNPNYLWIQVTLAVWAITSAVLQRCHSSSSWIHWSQMAWTIVDPLLITVLIHLSESPKESLLVAYPAFVAASGLWVRQSLVYAATLTSLLGFAVLLRLEPAMTTPPHHPLIFVAVLLCVSLIVLFQVRRMSILSRYV